MATIKVDIVSAEESVFPATLNLCRFLGCLAIWASCPDICR